MKTTCVCCGKRATHESVRSVGGAWYRCNTCNHAWRGLQAYCISVIANLWWPIKGPAFPVVKPRPLSGPDSSAGRSDSFTPPGPKPGERA